MPKIYSLLAMLIIAGTINAQLNASLVGTLDYVNPVNDVWGYVSEDSTEYALIGTQTGFSIVVLADPTLPKELFFIDGSTSTWRDMKTWDHYAYVITEASDGLLIVNLQNLPDTIEWKFENTKVGPFGDSIVSNHNIFIDEFGIVYLSGGNLNNGGVVLLDVATDPWNPKGLGFAQSNYSHDSYARDSILYSSDIYAGELSVQDVSDPKNISLLGAVKTPSEFTHNAWLSDDANVVYTTDERSNGYVTSYDISNFGDIKELDRFRPAATLGEGVIPHNVHVLNDYLIISYYTDGCIIVDAARPDNLIEVGNYDTFFESSGGFNGVWGVYPFLPSGRILVSDRQTGLYVVEPDYKRAGYLEGFVTAGERTTGEPLNNVKVEILTDENEILEPIMTKPDGAYKTGKAIPGAFDVLFSKAGYRDTLIRVDFENGVLVHLNVSLTPLQQFQLGGQVVKMANGEPLPDANVLLVSPDFTYVVEADSLGNYILEGVFEGTYKVFAGQWGEYVIKDIEVNGPLTELLVTEPGYYDDFNFDFGWQVMGTSIEAMWERGIPKSELLFNFFQCNPDSDVDDDLGRSSYVTGNAGGNAINDDVDEGFTLLSSPMMDLTQFTDPIVSYRPWMCHFGESTSYVILASNGTDTTRIDSISSEDITGFWQEATEIHVAEFLEITDVMQIHFLATDNSPDDSESTLKAGVDRFIVSGELVTSVNSPRPSVKLFNAYPNPFDESISIRLHADTQTSSGEIRLLNMSGQTIYQINGNQFLPEMTLPVKVHAGIYFLQYRNMQQVQTMKLIKVE